MKYIPADKLIAEIERRKNQTERRIDKIVPIRRKDTMDEEQLAKIELQDKVDKAYFNAVLITLSDILSFITSLQQEQQEVDLEKAFSSWWLKEEKHDYQASILYERYPIISMKLARHFYELGRNTRKEE